MSLPALEHLAYTADEDGDHPGGGHCAGLGGDTPEEGRRAMVEQYANALGVLVDAALTSGDGWSLSRPILFTTHQLCELALDLALDRKGAKRKGVKPGSRHSLETRMSAAVSSKALDYLTDEEREWCQSFIDAIVPITGDGFPGRYAQASPGGVQLDERWCCINPGAIRDAATVFAALCVAAAARVENE